MHDLTINIEINTNEPSLCIPIALSQSYLTWSDLKTRVDVNFKLMTVLHLICKYLWLKAPAKQIHPTRNSISRGGQVTDRGNVNGTSALTHSTAPPLTISSSARLSRFSSHPPLLYQLIISRLNSLTQNTPCALRRLRDKLSGTTQLNKHPSRTSRGGASYLMLSSSPLRPPPSSITDSTWVQSASPYQANSFISS